MKIIIFFLKLLLDAIRDTNKIVKYFKLIEINGYFVIIRLFIIRFFYGFSWIRNIKKIKTVENEKLKLSFSQDTIDLNNILYKLDSIGYTNIFYLKKNYLSKILNDILNNKLNINVKKQKNEINLYKRENENQIQYLERLKNNDISRLTGVLNVNNNANLKNFVLSKEILKLVSSYINSKTISINASYFISLPIKTSKYEKYENAQYFHWDNDFTKFLKLYIYLTDVDEQSGPHIYVSKTHKQKKINHSLSRLYSDQDIYNSYKDIKKFCANEGAFFFTDSYGIHKGEEPKIKPRIMLNIHYGNNKIKYHQDDLIINI
tara:strand:- start:332 stop:1285 length:954 start_codon:yes stop_codon:yes gene_type:complete